VIRGALALVALVVAVAAPVATGHTSTVATDPAPGASLPAAPQRIVVTHGQPVGAAGRARVTVDGTDVAGPARLDPADARRLVIPLTAGPAGRYRARWQVTAADGHSLAGELTFTVRATPPGRVAARAGTRITAAIDRLLAGVRAVAGTGPAPS